MEERATIAPIAALAPAGAAEASIAARPAMLAIGGGKGGVGKTCLAVNLAVVLARRGWRTVLVDADLSCSNVEAMLGAQAAATLDDFFLTGNGPPALDDLLSPTPFEHLRYIAGTSGLLEVANPRYQQKQAFLKALQTLDADVVIVDLDAGAHLNTLDLFLLTGCNGFLVITPERTSIDNAFKFIRSALFRRMERFYNSPELAFLLKRNETLPKFIDSVMGHARLSEDHRNTIVGEMLGLARSICPKVVVNRARNPYEAQIAMNILAKSLRTHLEIKPRYLGLMYFDSCVQEAVNSSMPFVVSHPRARISGCVTDIANRLGYI